MTTLSLHTMGQSSKKAALVAFFALIGSVCLTSPASAATITRVPYILPISTADASVLPGTIRVSGFGRVTAAPDTATLSVGIETESKTASGAQADNRAKTNTLIDALVAAGIKKTDIETQWYNLYPMYDWKDNERIFRGYQVNHTLNVKIRDLTKVSDILTLATESGATTIGGVNYTLENSAQYYDAARGQAVESVRRKASRLASYFGVNLSGIVSAEESSSDGISVENVSNVKYDMGGATSAVAPMGDSVTPGKIEIIVTVNAVFAIDAKTSATPAMTTTPAATQTTATTTTLTK